MSTLPPLVTTTLALRTESMRRASSSATKKRRRTTTTPPRSPTTRAENRRDGADSDADDEYSDEDSGDTSTRRPRGGGDGASTCRDRGGDCARLSYLCSNAVYDTIMRSECAYTCNRCGEAGGDDRRSANNGDDNDDKRRQNERDDEGECGSDCAHRSQLQLDLQRAQATAARIAASIVVDFRIIVMSRRVAAHRALVTRSSFQIYAEFMSDECPRTCGKC